MAEKIVEVNNDNKPIGVRPKEDFYKSVYIHRSSALILFNKKVEILVQRRSPKKKLFAGLLDFSVSCHVSEGESYEEAMHREMKEELGIQAKIDYELEHVYMGKEDKTFIHVFTAHHDGPFRLQEEEVESVQWMTEEQLRKQLQESPDVFSPAFRQIMVKYLRIN
jgi:isopentenyldiphosphate isomerase